MKKMPQDIYKQSVAIAKSYYAMLKRNKAAFPHNSALSDTTQKRDTEKIQAVERAWNRMENKCACEFIQKNIFEGCPMKYINLPFSLRTMKRLRSKFIQYVAEELGEI